MAASPGAPAMAALPAIGATRAPGAPAAVTSPSAGLPGPLPTLPGLPRIATTAPLPTTLPAVPPGGLPAVKLPTAVLPSVPSVAPARPPAPPVQTPVVAPALPAAAAPAVARPAPVASPAVAAPVATPSAAVTAPTPAAPSPAGAAFEPGGDPLKDLAARCEALDGSDYFAVMRLPRDAGAVQIKKAFHHWSRTLHPDRFYNLEDAALKAQVSELYKRITEAYFVLRDEVKRKKYLEDVSGPDRAARLRYTEQTEAEVKAQAKKQVEEQLGTHPKARQFFAEALKDEAAGRFKDAERNVKSALMYDLQNAAYKAKLAEVTDALERTRDKTEALKIK